MTPTLISDSMTIAYKEWREWFARSARLGWIGLLLLMAIWSIAAPFALRHASAGAMLVVLVWLSLPMAISGVVVADSFAGERERQTLETLLTSRLSDHAIVIGKIVAVVIFALVLLLLDLAPGIAVIASGAAGPEIARSAARLGLWALIIGVPLIALVIGAGAIFALYAYTARQSLLLIMAFVGALLLSSAGIVVWIAGQPAGDPGAPVPGAHVIALAVLFVLDGALLVWLMACAHRTRLLALR